VPSGFPSDSGSPQPASEPNTGSVAVADNQPVEPARVPDPPKAPEKEFAELVITSNSVVGLQLDGAISSDRASLEDRVEARVVRDVRVGNEVALVAFEQLGGRVRVVLLRELEEHVLLGATSTQKWPFLHRSGACTSTPVASVHRYGAWKTSIFMAWMSGAASNASAHVPLGQRRTGELEPIARKMLSCRCSG